MAFRLLNSLSLTVTLAGDTYAVLVEFLDELGLLVPSKLMSFDFIHIA